MALGHGTAFGAGCAVVTLGAVPIGLGISEVPTHGDPWHNGWVWLGAVIWCIAAATILGTAGHLGWTALGKRRNRGGKGKSHGGRTTPPKPRSGGGPDAAPGPRADFRQDNRGNQGTVIGQQNIGEQHNAPTFGLPLPPPGSVVSASAYGGDVIRYELLPSQPSPGFGGKGGGERGGQGGAPSSHPLPFGIPSGGGGGGGEAGPDGEGGEGGRGGIGAGGGGGGYGGKKGGKGGDGGPGMVQIVPKDKDGNPVGNGAIFLRPDSPASHDFVAALEATVPPEERPDIVWTDENGRGRVIVPPETDETS
jgi:hypothetical protein